MKKYSAILVAIALALCFVFASCAPVVEHVASNLPTKQPTVTKPSQDVENILSANAQQNTVEQTPSKRPQAKPDYTPKGEYNKGVVLVKNKDGVKNSTLTSIFYKSVEQLYAGSSWYKITLKDNQDTEEAVKALAKTEHFEKVDYDYVMKADGEVQSVDISGNGYAPDPDHLETLGIHKAWLNSGGNNHAPGGSPDVIVAVIDTGVDYNHEDLRNNIWYNSAEIPDNGIDDDGNGYVDDIRGWDCVGDDNDPMDDNGHGTHVAGIVAAENNKIGTVGVAFNCKVMVLKAGTSSGYFNNSDIVEAIRYAYMNGASVINMSFGGYAISIPVEDALMDAYNQCVLVAAAGNDTLCNRLDCPVHYPYVGVCYPAALPYVIGVMSCDNSGRYCSGFSNFDHNPNNSVEYEVYAPGEAIPSTWPGNKYARLNGTSMAAPTVAGIAALLRSYYTDREVYSNKYIQSQIVNTGNQTPIIDQYTMGTHTVADAYLAMTQIPTPNVNLYDAYIFDNVEFSSKNNGDGRIDAGETIRVGIELINHGGVASNVVATLDTSRMGDSDIVDPYFDITKAQITMSDIGTYSVRNSGLIYDNDMIVGVENYFEFVVAENCPNDYVCVFNVTFSYTNGLDEKDNTVYTNADLPAHFDVSVVSGVLLPTQFTEDTTLTADNLYILPYSTYIHEGVTVTIEPGTRIQFYTDDTDSLYYDTGIPYINVAGKLISNGSVDAPVEMFPCDSMDHFMVDIRRTGNGYVELNHTNITNAVVSANKANHCYFSQNYAGPLWRRYLDNGKVLVDYWCGSYYNINIDECSTSVFYKLGGCQYYHYNPQLQGTFDTCIFVDSTIISNYSNATFTNCVFQGNQNLSAGAEEGNVSSLAFRPDQVSVRDIHKNSETGTSYLYVYSPYSDSMNVVRTFAKALGGDIACIETEEELNYILGEYFYDGVNYNSNSFILGLRIGSDTWINGEPVGDFIKQRINRQDLNQGWLYRSYDDWGYTTGAPCYLVEIPGSIYVDSISLFEYSVEIDAESSYQLHPQVLPNTYAGELKFVSDDESVAIVSDSGLVTPLRQGTANIYVYSPDYNVYTICQVTVKEKIALENISLSYEKTTIPVGTGFNLSVIFTPSNTTERLVTYTSSDDSVISVDEYGYVYAHKVGSATITATAQGKSASITFTVVNPLTSVSFEDLFYLTHLGDTDDSWKPILNPADATDVRLSYDTSDRNVAYVDEDGNLVRASVGQATIRVTDEISGLFADLHISVSESEVQATPGIKEFSAKNERNVAILEDGSLWTWGANRMLPVKLRDNVLSAAHYTSGTYYSSYEHGNWHDVSNYEIFYIVDISGNLSEYIVCDCGATELRPPFLTDVKKVIVNPNNQSYYALRNDGSVWAWGDNGYGQLGIGTTSWENYPVQVLVNNIVDISAFHASVIFLDKDGNVWGAGGQEGKINTPTKLDSGVKEIWSAYHHGYYKFADGTIREISYSYLKTNNTYTNQEYGCDYVIYDCIGNTWRCIILKDGYVYSQWDDMQYDFSQVTNAKYMYFTYNTLYIVTGDGKLYGVGENSYYELANLTTQHAYTPSRIHFGLQTEDEPLVVEDDNLDDATLRDYSITLDFNSTVLASTQFGSITLKNSNGNALSVTKQLVLDKFVITPFAELKDGETYTLTIPANSLLTPSVAQNEEISYTFVYHNTTAIDFVQSNITGGAVLDVGEHSFEFNYTYALEGDEFDSISVTNDRGEVVSADVTLDAGKLTINTTLDVGNYILTVPESALKDNVGGANEEVVINFVVAKALKFSSTSHPDGSVRLDEHENIVIVYENAIEGENFSQILLADTNGNVVETKVTLVDGILTIAHDGLEQGSEYILTIPQGALADEFGNESSQNISTFTTYAPVEMLYSSLVSGQNNVSCAPRFRFEYNGAFDIDTDKISIMSGETKVNFSVYSEGNIHNIYPHSLTEDTEYVLTIGKGAIIDECGVESDLVVLEFRTINLEDRFYWTIENATEVYNLLMKEGLNNGQFKNNAILNNLNDTNVEHWLRVQGSNEYLRDWTIGISGNYWGTTNETLIDKMIVDFDDYQSLPDIVYKNYLTEAPSNTFPFVTNVYFINKDGEIVNTIGKETVQVVVEFNRDMDTSIPLNVTFGSRVPYADYKIEGEYVDARTWVGEYTLKAFIENGSQYFRIKNGCAAGDPFLKLYESDGGRHSFEIDTTAAQAMIMQAVADEGKINLSWMQDDYDTLLGYNIYRSTEKDGNFVRINPTVIPAGESTFVDTNAEPGVNYWYTFTVVQTDFTESAPAGKVSCAARDTILPNIYHTPVNQGYMNNNLVISATATDNIAVQSVTLYYRTVGTTEWKSLTMLKQNDKYSATIFGSELSLAGLEYYIVASDGVGSIEKGSASAPYTVVIKDASAISRKGDVDGDGVVTAKDALMLMQCINGDLLLTDDEFKRADLNGDSVLNSMEALRILQYINGNVNTLEM